MRKSSLIILNYPSTSSKLKYSALVYHLINNLRYQTEIYNRISILFNFEINIRISILFLDLHLEYRYRLPRWISYITYNFEIYNRISILFNFEIYIRISILFLDLHLEYDIAFPGGYRILRIILKFKQNRRYRTAVNSTFRFHIELCPY